MSLGRAYSAMSAHLGKTAARDEEAALDEPNVGQEQTPSASSYRRQQSQSSPVDTRTPSNPAFESSTAIRTPMIDKAAEGKLNYEVKKHLKGINREERFAELAQMYRNKHAARKVDAIIIGDHEKNMEVLKDEVRHLIRLAEEADERIVEERR
ncbi:hypothetical protein N7452_006355 [Penicillium brevicompactum]|uniref:Uncharacterized protein n=1 Tax=Penicillium brevicompactum TaxID=5074 RepID=A0A9W9QKE0_PENBR|nr:hypothetical protein N7452_006355 [Penicillium brevicompactum]